MKISIYLTIFILGIISVNFAITQSEERYPEMVDDELIAYEIKYREEKNEDEKKYLEPVVRQSKFDLNKDGKISKREIREALKYVLYPKDPVKRIQINKNLDSYVKNNIDLYVKTLEKESFTYKQFANLMKNISPYRFLNPDVMHAFSQVQKSKVNEHEADL